MPINTEPPSSTTNSFNLYMSQVSAAEGTVKTKRPKQAQSKEVFKRQRKGTSVSFPVSSLFRVKNVEGDIGLEVEVEGNKFPKDPDYSPNGSGAGSDLIPSTWKYCHDGSLRGHDNAEYVFRKPLKFEEVPQAVTDLWKMFSKFGSVLDESNRTSVHVHLNAQKWHLNRVCAFVAMYFAVEELLTEWCGDHRVGNLFCLRAKDAPGIISKLKAFIQNDGQMPALTEGLHYAGLNAHALMKFGSIEVRALRGCTDPETILNWVSVLERIYKLSAEFPDPRAICENFSGEGPMAFLNMILGDKTQLIQEGISYNNQQIMASLYEGIRMAQDLCYCRDWSQFRPSEIAPDPFGRSAKKVAQSLQQAQNPEELAYAQLLEELSVTTTNTIPTPPFGHWVTADWSISALEAEPNESSEDDYDPEICDDPDCEECNP